MNGLVISDIAARLSGNKLMGLRVLIDWEPFRSLLGNLDRSGRGPKGYSVLGLLRALILQAWHSLSDLELEAALKVRLDFIAFTELEEAPDETTICRFRNLLIEKGLLEKVLKIINDQLEAKELKVKGVCGAVLDATIIESAAKPRKEIELVAVDRKEEEVKADSQTQEKPEEVKRDSGTTFESKDDLSFSKDNEARWLKKGKKYHFGYKAFVTVDEGDGYITSVHITPANCSEVKEVENVLKKCGTITRLYADKGYASAANEELLSNRKIKSAIMKKAQKNKPLRFWEKAFNFLVSRKRYKVEQGFGTWKRRFRFSRASYFGLSKVESQCTIKAIAFNLLKGINKALDMNLELCRA